MGLTWKLAYDSPQEVGELFQEYTHMLIEGEPKFEEYLGLQNYEEELAHLEYKYGLPKGRLYLAYWDGALAGCVGLRKMDDENCEMKRLYVRSRFRGKGIGERLVELILSEAERIGYKAMYLDTLPFLDSAVRMYRRFGFYDIPCYNESPIDTTIYMRLDLPRGKHLVKCQEGDLDLLAAFYDKVTTHLAATVNYPKWRPGDYPGRESCREAIRQGVQYACLECGQVLAGMILNEDPQGDYSLGEWSRDLEQGEYLLIHTLAADPDLSGKGVGRFMVEAAIERAQKKGYQAVRIDVVPDNIPAIKLYETCGFQYAGEKDLGREIPTIPTFALYELNF